MAASIRTTSSVSSILLVGALFLIAVGQFIMITRVTHSQPVTGAVASGLSDFVPDTTTRRSSARMQPIIPREPADGSFNGAPIYLKTGEPPHSRVHCVGENYQKTAWQQRSCRFSNLCFNMTARDYVLFSSPDEANLLEHVQARDFLQVSSAIEPKLSVALGGINLKWGNNPTGVGRINWFPKVQPVPDKLSYYALPDNTLLVPFHSMNGANPGHLVWDDFLPTFTLLDMFQLEDRDLLMMRYVLQDDDRGLWASCDVRAEKTALCKKMIQKFYPLMVGPSYPYQLSTTQDFDLQQNSGAPPGVELVCAKTAVAGFGSLTDHGPSKMHGWERKDYTLTHNHGRGGLFYRFRNHQIAKMGLSTAPVPTAGPHHIVFSTFSSDIHVRSVGFEAEMDVAKKVSDNVVVEGYQFKELSLLEQLEVVHQAAIFVSVCGGGAVSGMYLPQGAAAFIYYSEDGGAENNKRTHLPARLDWDLYNALSHVRVHWLPLNTRKSRQDLETLSLLIRHELRLVETHAFG